MPVVNVLAPYGGQNNREGAYDLPPQFATSLVNWIPGPGYLDARGPCAAASSNTVGRPIQAMWRHPGGNSIFVTSNGEIYLAQDPIGASLSTAMTSGDVHGNIFQDRLILCNGVDTPQVYDGTSVIAAVISGTGLTVSNLYGSVTFKGRAYYWENGQRYFWYAAAGAYQGALSKYDLSTFTRSDGTLVSIAPMTFDGGSGPDDLIAFLFSNGEVLVYQGDDPGNTNAWQSVGRFQIGSMIGRACWAVVGSSTLVATELGVVDLARALAVGPTDDSATAGQQFGAVNMAAPSGFTLTERKLALDAYNRVLWLALFDSSAISTAENMLALHGMDTESRAWFTTLDIASAGGSGSATAFVPIPSGLYMAASDSGRLITGPSRAVTGVPTDDFFTNGALTYTAVQTFTLDAPEQKKQLTGIRPTLQQVSTSSPSASMTVSVTSEEPYNASTVTIASPTTPAMHSVSGYGTRLFVSQTVTSKSGLRWHSTDLQVKPGRQV